MNKNSKLLESFAAYCNEYPEQRFWQALRNWSEYNFIYGSRETDPEAGDLPKVEDTFYL